MARPRIIKTPEEFTQRAQAYFDACAEQGLPTTITGLALALGFAAVQSLHDYEARPEFSDAVKWARLFVQNEVETRLFMTDKPTASIFWLKAQANWSEKSRVEHSGPDGTPIQVTGLDDQARADRVAGLLDAARARRTGRAADGSDAT